MILSCYQMWKRPWNLIYYLVGFKKKYDNLIKKYFLSWTEKNCGYEMKKQMEILILLLLNMITTAFTNVVAAIKVLNDLITITKLSLLVFVATNFSCIYFLKSISILTMVVLYMCISQSNFALENASWECILFVTEF